jgi:sulfur carrier protein
LKISVNGEARVTKSATLDDLCRELGYGYSKVATALNGEFVSEARRAAMRLREGDSIEVLSPRQGG